MNKMNQLCGLMCKSCRVECTKIEEIIDCFVSTLEMRGFIRERSNGTEKQLTCENVYNSLKSSPNDWIKDEVVYDWADYEAEI